MLACSTELWRETLHHHLKGLLVNLVAIVAAALILQTNAPPWFKTWAMASLALTTVRFVFYLHCKQVQRRQPGTPPPRGQVRLHHLAVLLAGASWGALGWWGMPFFVGAQQFAILVILSALAGGATGTLAPMRVTGKLYVLLLIVPACVQILAHGGAASLMLTVLGGMFAWVMVSSHHHNHLLLVRSIALARDKEALVQALSAKTEQVLKTNSHLEERVAERTRELHQIAHHDLLTGLLNRRGILFAEASVQAHQAASLATLFIDLDRFKQINDGLSHDWGDLVLQEVGQRLQQVAQTLASQCHARLHLVSRWGGDEFILCLVCDAPSALAMQQMARAVQARLAEPCVIGGHHLHLGASIGVALHPIDPALTLKTAISCADLATSEAKRLGRGRVEGYRDELATRQQRKLALSVALNTAHQDGSLHVLFQPIVCAHSGVPVAYEALLRWHCAGLGPVSPEEFILLAEETDHIVALGHWVLHQACQTAAGWPGPTPAKVAVNTSIRQLVRADFCAEVSAALAQSGLPAVRLVIEVTESVLDAQHLQQALTSLHALHQLGVEIHIDDFGTGYSSLSRLREFPVHAIKIDKSFALSGDVHSLAVIEGAVLIAHRFGLRVIAEGIESAAQASALALLGVDELQGYWFGRPSAQGPGAAAGR